MNHDELKFTLFKYTIRFHHKFIKKSTAAFQIKLSVQWIAAKKFSIFTVDYLQLLELIPMAYRQSFGSAESLFPRTYDRPDLLAPNTRSKSEVLHLFRHDWISRNKSWKAEATCATWSEAATSLNTHSMSFARISPKKEWKCFTLKGWNIWNYFLSFMANKTIKQSLYIFHCCIEFKHYLITGIHIEHTLFEGFRMFIKLK